VIVAEKLGVDPEELFEILFESEEAIILIQTLIDDFWGGKPNQWLSDA